MASQQNRFQIPQTRLTYDQVDQLIDTYSKEMHSQKQKFLGFQANQHINNVDVLGKLLDISSNNIGDPFSTGAFKINSKEIQVSVLEYYAKLWNFQPRVDNSGLPFNPMLPNSFWGYILSMGSSEGNLMSLWTGRDYIQGKQLLYEESKQKTKKNAQVFKLKLSSQCKFHKIQKEGNTTFNGLKQTVFLSSTSTHYSVMKLAAITKIRDFSEVGNQIYIEDLIEGVKEAGERFPTHVPVYGELDGRIDAEKLVKLVEFFAKKGHGIIIVLNYGTTFTGAFDQVNTICKNLEVIFQTYGYNDLEWIEQKQSKISKRKGYWIHVDGALGGSYVPYLHKAYSNQDEVVDVSNGVSYYKTDIPTIDFQSNQCLSSIVMSGHKFIGAPWPCGIYMTRHKYQLSPSQVMYIGSTDTTLSGSRNGLSPWIFWNYLSRNSDQKIIRTAKKCLEKAKQAEEKIREVLQQKNTKLGLNLKVNRAPFSLCLVFDSVNEYIEQKYSLSSQTLTDQQGNEKHYHHLFVMQWAIEQPEMLRQFFRDIAQPFAFTIEDTLECTSPTKSYLELQTNASWSESVETFE